MLIKIILRQPRCGHRAGGRLLSGWCARKCAKPVDKSEKYEQKGVRVAVLGASTTTGQALCLLLKQNPLITHIFMYDKNQVGGIAADLRHLDTRCDVTGFQDKDPIQAVRNAEIIVMLGREKFNKDAQLKDRIVSEGKRLMSWATHCANYAPKAVMIDCVYPISITLPLISEIYRKNHWYHPGRVIGSVAFLQMRLNTFLASHQSLDPTSVHVPLLGGPEEDLVIPLFSRSTPSSLPLGDAKLLTNRFRGLEDDDEVTMKAKNHYEYCPHGSAFAINRLVTAVALGLLGDAAAVCTAFVRSNFVTSCRHIVSTVKFGPHGVAHNYGVPRLTKNELKMFEKVTLELGRREKIANEYMEMSESPMPAQTSHESQLSEKIFATSD